MKLLISKRKLLIFLLICLIIFEVVFIIYKNEAIKDDTNREDDYSEVQSIKKTSLEEGLSSTLRLGTNIRVQKNARVLLDSNTEKLDNSQYKGAYVGVSDGEIVFSGALGFANAQKKEGFKYDSSFLVGKYQDYINNAILVEMIQHKKLILQDKLSEYLPNLKQSSKISVNDLLFGKIHYYRSDNYSNDFELYDGRIDKENPGKKCVDTVIKQRLITAISHLSYIETLNRLLVKKVEASDTRAYSASNVFANDVSGYSYLKEGSKVKQKNIIKKEPVIPGSSQLRMSIADILKVHEGILKNLFFEEKYNRLFRSICNSSRPKNMFLNDYYSFSSHDSGQSIHLYSDLSGSKIVLIASNYPNRAVSNDELARKLWNFISNN
ncbi:hypothetical protein [Lactiplantibacillus modestisalitolerans]|uniref:Serine hydrolase n=1 Tax=Lactiplantibacillus modestisalitolerans TaxID=1457219 RepID=A0ABV5WUT5_9LACO|nr:hypothetical protein [Lactiplantibacillus modestisalitolerans]